MHVDLLLTDSLGRPLAGARYSVHRGDDTAPESVLALGRLGDDGRVSLGWREPTMTLCIGYRALMLRRGPGSGVDCVRNRLTCLGYDAGSPDQAADPARALRALGAFVAHAVFDCGADRSQPPERLLADYVLGRLGVGEPARAGTRTPPPSPRRRWLRRRRTLGNASDRARSAAASGAGSHLVDDARSDEPPPRRAVALAVTVGPGGSEAAANRVVVYDWFTGLGPPPRDGNLVEALIDGEQAWGRAAADIESATEELCVTSWWVDPDSELTRPPDLAVTDPAERHQHRFAAYVERLAARGGRTAILLWSWLGTPLVNPTLRRWAVRAGDNVEVLQRDHPELFGSFHQKTLVVDRRVAHCGGFNLRQNDWDALGHALGDPRRNPHRVGVRARAARLPAFPPRHDVAVRIEGPLVGDVHDNFVACWNGALASVRPPVGRSPGRLRRLWQRVQGLGPAEPVAPMTPPSRPAAGDSLAQLVLTEPHADARAQPIHDVLVRAIHNARRLIYIENQYFRCERITRALLRALRQHPDMDLVVVTNPVAGPWRLAYGGAYYAARAARTLAALRPGFTLYRLLACGRVGARVRYVAVELHAKVMIVDDQWCTVGSANLNERSIHSEFEANVAIEDARFAQRLRVALMAEHLGLGPDDGRLADMAGAAALWRERAAANAAARRAGTLADGLAHPFEQQPAWRWLRGRARWF